MLQAYRRPLLCTLVALCTCHVRNRALLVHETNAHLNFGTSSWPACPPLLCFFTSTLHARQLSAKTVLSAAAAAAAQPSPRPPEHTHCDRPIAPTPRALRAPGIGSININTTSTGSSPSPIPIPTRSSAAHRPRSSSKHFQTPWAALSRK